MRVGSTSRQQVDAEVSVEGGAGRASQAFEVRRTREGFDVAMELGGEATSQWEAGVEAGSGVEGVADQRGTLRVELDPATGRPTNVEVRNRNTLSGEAAAEAGSGRRRASALPEPDLELALFGRTEPRRPSAFEEATPSTSAPSAPLTSDQRGAQPNALWSPASSSEHRGPAPNNAGSWQ